MQKYNATVISTTGAPGTGKTYSRCARYLYDWWLPEETGVHYSNFPVKIEAFLAKYPDARERIKIIPPEELEKWALCDGIHGPWEYFRDFDLQGAHIAIDECHNFLRRSGRGVVANSDRWQRWLGEIRHRGCTVEFLSQDPHKVHPTVEQHSAVRIQLVSSEDRRDPIFGCLLGDWYELRAGVTGEYENVIWQLEERRINGKWRQSDFLRFTIEPQYFGLYDSFNAPQSGGGKATGQDRVFQKRGKFGLLSWFLKRNWWRLVTRSFIGVCALWVCFGGGIPWLVMHFNSYVRAVGAGNKTATESQPAKPQDAARFESPTQFKRQQGRTPPQAPAPAQAVVEPNPAVTSNGNVPRIVEVVRSETYQHGTLEVPPSGELQQQSVPRVTLIAPDFVCLDDGMMVFKGDAVGPYVLVKIFFLKRMAVFRSQSDDTIILNVPVGGPVGRMRKAVSIHGGPASNDGPAKVLR